jgi:hypothetical protein
MREGGERGVRVHWLRCRVVVRRKAVEQVGEGGQKDELFCSFVVASAERRTVDRV